jgi:hypothetical protein
MCSKWLCLAVPLLSGCAWLGARGRDLGDIFRVEGSIGVGLQANVTGTELLHLGAGSSRRHSGGWAYGFGTSERRDEDHLPLSLISMFGDPDSAALHSVRLRSDKENPWHGCQIVGPVTFDKGPITKSAMQFWDLEVGVMALVAGVDLGFNLAEFADFFLGWFGLDLGGDDTREGRARRRLWIPSEPEGLTER